MLDITKNSIRTATKIRKILSMTIPSGPSGLSGLRHDATGGPQAEGKSA